MYLVLAKLDTGKLVVVGWNTKLIIEDIRICVDICQRLINAHLRTCGAWIINLYIHAEIPQFSLYVCGRLLPDLSNIVSR